MATSDDSDGGGSTRVDVKIPSSLAGSAGGSHDTDPSQVPAREEPTRSGAELRGPQAAESSLSLQGADWTEAPTGDMSRLAADDWSVLDKEPARWPTASGESQVARQQAVEPEGAAPFRKATEPIELGAQEHAARLVALAGLSVGREFGLGKRVTIGRSVACDIVLAESSVSREHAEIVCEHDQWRVIDRKSGNGTFVNGARTSESPLRSGDEVSFGKARFRFLADGEVWQPLAEAGESAAPARRSSLVIPRRYLVGSAAVLTLSLIFAGVLLLRARDADPGQGSFRYYLAGIDAFKARDWVRAEQEFAVYLGFVPSSERGRAYLESIAREKTNAQQLSLARLALERGDLLAAHTQASGIEDSVYEEEARSVLREIDGELDARLQKANQALSHGQRDKALELLGVLEAVRPNDVVVQDLVARARHTSKGIAIAARGTNSTTRPKGVVEAALEAYQDARLDEAESLLAASGDEPRVTGLLGRIRRFRVTYEAALVEHRAKRAAPALSLLEEALALDGKVSPRRGKIRDEVERKIADMYYVQGIDAELSRKLEQALSYFAAALAHDPNHVPARRKLEELQKR